MRAFKTFFSVLFLFVALPTVFAASTTSDYQKDFDFSQLRTFTFKTDRAGNDPLATNTIQAERIQAALANQFQANGFTQSQDNPDFTIALSNTCVILSPLILTSPCRKATL